MTRPLCLSFAVLFVAQLGCSNDCDREACDAFSKPASAAIAQGIAGVVSLDSDTVYSGCRLCVLSTAGLEVWPSPTPARDAAACPLALGSSAQTITAIGRYQQALDPGEYLVCVSAPHARPCLGLTVSAGKVTTLNVKQVQGPTMLAVLDPRTPTFRSNTFDCPPP
jgi:hypothetical protein